MITYLPFSTFIYYLFFIALENKVSIQLIYIYIHNLNIFILYFEKDKILSFFGLLIGISIRMRTNQNIVEIK